MKELYMDEPAKSKTRILRQIHTADPVAMDRKSCLYTILEYTELARLSAHIDWISCMYVPYMAQFPRLPFCWLIYIQLLHLWSCTYYENLGGLKVVSIVKKNFNCLVSHLTFLIPMKHYGAWGLRRWPSKDVALSRIRFEPRIYQLS